MDVKNCRRCKRLFNYIGGQQICPACREELEKKFQEAKKYLFNNRHASVKDVAENCDVDEYQIRQLIREERLEFSSGIEEDIVCEICGKPINTGRYCNECKLKSLTDLKDAIPVEVNNPVKDTIKKTNSPRMRYLDRK